MVICIYTRLADADVHVQQCETGPPADFVPIHVYVFMCANHMCVYSICMDVHVCRMQSILHIFLARIRCALAQNPMSLGWFRN